MIKKCCDICEREITIKTEYFHVRVLSGDGTRMSNHRWNKELCESCFNAMETFLEDLRNGKSISD